jgi:hypothetical protein
VTFAPKNPNDPTISTNPLAFFGDGDVQLFEVSLNQDGTVSSDTVFSPGQLPWSDVDPSGTQLTFPSVSYVADPSGSPFLKPGDPTNPSAPSVLSLPPGQYRLGLGAYSSTAGSLGLNPTVDASSSPFYDLADFTVVRKGVTLPDAVSLGTIGPQVQTVPGSLDLSAGQNNVDLYKITLGPGHFWRLGLQLDAQRIGSSLQGAISLFDSSGKVLATRDTGTGRPDYPDDPYLFDGLSPGVYYIGVSGAGNLPGQPGGYDPVGGTIGTGKAQAGGKYVLNVVADLADAPAKVTGFTLNWDDPLDPSPTGLTLDFSDPIDTSSLLTDGTIQSPLVAVDQSGHLFHLTPSGYQESQNRVSFTFDQRLPAGQYTLQDPQSGGVTDLAGKVPVAPALPQGVLAAWTVVPRLLPSAPNDLGVLWPLKSDGVTPSDGVTRTDTIVPGREVDYRVVIPITGWYSLRTPSGQSTLSVTRLGKDGLATVDPGSSDSVDRSGMYLEEGVCLFTMRAVGTGPISVTWTLKPAKIDPESLISNGVGHSAALSLRLLDGMSSDLMPGAPPSSSTTVPANPPPGSSTTSPPATTTSPPATTTSPPATITSPPATTPSPPATTTSPPATTGPTAPPASSPTAPAVPPAPSVSGSPAPSPQPQAGASFVPPATGGGAVVSSSGLASVPAALLVTTNSGLLGGPSAQVEHIAAVGPVVAGGSVALADSSPGLLPGITYGSAGPREDPVASTADGIEISTRPSASDGGLARAEGVARGALAEAQVESSRADARALVQADRIAQIAAMLQHLVSPEQTSDQDLPTTGGERPSGLLVAEVGSGVDVRSTDQPADRQLDRIEHAELAIPTALLLASAAAYRLRQFSARWWRQSRNRWATDPRPRMSRLGPGPHCFRRDSRATTSVRVAQGH